MAVSKIWVFAEADGDKPTIARSEILTNARELADTESAQTASCLHRVTGRLQCPASAFQHRLVDAPGSDRVAGAGELRVPPEAVGRSAARRDESRASAGFDALAVTGGREGSGHGFPVK